MNHPKRILVLGGYGTGNLGDELILGALSRLLGRAYPGCELRVLSHDPQTSEGFHGIPSVEIPPFVTLRKTVSSVLRGRLEWFSVVGKTRNALEESVEWCDLFVLGGGNLLADHPFYFLEHFTGQIVRRAAKRGKPVAVLGTGLGPINTAKGRRLLGELADWATAAALREPAGAEACRSAGFADPRISGDPVLLAPPFADQAALTSLPRAVVSLRPSGQGQRLPESVGWALDSVRARMDVGGLAMDPCDAPVIRDHLGAPGMITAPTPATVVAEVRRSSLVLGMRLHACIVAAAFGVPVVPIAYHAKVTAFARSVGVEPLSMDGTMSAEDVERVVLGTVDALEERREDLKTRVRTLRHEGLAELDTALGALPFDPPIPATPEAPSPSG